MARPHLRAALVSLLAACRAATPEPATRPPASTKPDPDALPQPAPAIDPAVLEGDAKCGPFHSRELARRDHELLDDRLRVRFLPDAQPQGNAEAARLEVQRDGIRIFVGARETYSRGDELFERRATKLAAFGGDYQPFTVPGRDGALSIVIGIARKPDPGSDMLAVAHGWFLDPNRDVLDVAVFVSSGVEDLAGCRRFAQQVIATVADGQRRLSYGTGDEIVTAVSYTKFRYRLPTEWMMTGSAGIHDFARISFRRRGRFPGTTSLELGLDSHPGDWTSEGTEAGERKGKLLGLAVTWHLTQTAESAGAWTISEEVAERDHAVASIHAATPADRDAAIAFAESIRVDR